MTKRQWVTSVALVGFVGFAMTGCTHSWFGGKKKSTTGELDTIGGNGPGIETTTGDQALPTRDTIAGKEAVTSQLDTVLFDYDSAQIADTERAKVEAAGQTLKTDAKTSLVLEGNCDERGSKEYNMTLGERRALAVRAYLIGLGIDGTRIQTRSYGSEKPKDPAHTEEAWRVNRRVEFVTVQ